MTFVQARPGEHIDALVRRFKNDVEKSGVLREFRRRQRFMTESELRRRKSQANARRRQRARTPA